MTAISGGLTGWLLVVQPSALLASYAVLAGALAAYLSMVVLAYRRHSILLINTQLGLFLVALGLSVAWLLQEPSLGMRIFVFIILSSYVFWEAKRGKLLPPLHSIIPGSARQNDAIICFAGAAYSQPSWTNRQHIMTQLSSERPVLYIEARIWIVRLLLDNWRSPGKIVSFLRRTIWPQQMTDTLYVKSQWNLIPGSRESALIAAFNHYLNRWHVIFSAYFLGFNTHSTIWIYDTEAAEFLSAFPNATVVYDCVDDHAAQAGVDRNPKRVQTEEQLILGRANLVTVTSERLFQQKSGANSNTHLVVNAGDTKAYASPPSTSWPFSFPPDGPVIGSVGALDSYKYDFDLLHTIASRHTDWNFVLIGAPLVRHDSREAGVSFTRLQQLPNIHALGPMERQEVPALVAHFDICVIPYRANEYNRASFPLKFWEFMASGKPIVVSGLPELQPYEELVSFAESTEDFEAAITASLQGPDVHQQKRRILARDHSWQSRACALSLLLASTREDNGGA